MWKNLSMSKNLSVPCHSQKWIILSILKSEELAKIIIFGPSRNARVVVCVQLLIDFFLGVSHKHNIGPAPRYERSWIPSPLPALFKEIALIRRLHWRELRETRPAPSKLKCSASLTSYVLILSNPPGLEYIRILISRPDTCERVFLRSWSARALTDLVALGTMKYAIRNFALRQPRTDPSK